MLRTCCGPHHQPHASSASEELEDVNCEADQDQTAQVELRMDKYCKKDWQVTCVQEVKDLRKVTQLVSSKTTLQARSNEPSQSV